MNSNLENKGIEKLKEAFKEINQWEYVNLHLEASEDVSPSIRYQKRMERLIRWQKLPYWKYVNTVGKRVAVFVLAITVTFALSMTVSAVRKPVVEFISDTYEKLVEIFFEEGDIAKAPDTIETVYTLGCIPDDYTLEKSAILNNRTNLIWKNKNLEQIIFAQYILDGSYTLDHENGDFEILNIAGKKVAYMNKYGTKKFYWNTEEYAFSLMIPDSFSEEDCQRMIESIVKQ